MDSLTFQETARYISLLGTAGRELAGDSRFHPGNVETAMGYLERGDFDGAMRYSPKIAATIMLRAAMLAGPNTLNKAKQYLAETGAVWALVS